MRWLARHPIYVSSDTTSLLLLWFNTIQRRYKLRMRQPNYLLYTRAIDDAMKVNTN